MSQIQKVVPKWTEVGREALIVVAGAVIAAMIIGRMPKVRDWIKKQWDGAPGGF